MSKKLNLNVFVERAREIHGDKYNYSQSEYTGMLEKIKIICPEHGEFWQTPANHLKGKGCPTCGHILTWNKRGRINTDKVIELFKEIHGDKYDYSRVQYRDMKTKVCIICPLHGEFWQTPEKHIKRGFGCPKCGVIKRSQNKILSIDDFIEKARTIHGDKYDYSKVEYINSHTKVCIICPEHGEFWQTPNKHLSGNECPECNDRKNKHECKLWRNLQEKYANENIIHEYHNKEILGRKSIDIYFPGRKIGIEYQGGQHFRPVKYFGGYNKFLEIAKRDKEKYDECTNNGIKLFYYTDETWNVTDNYIDKVYTNFNELCSRIDEILDNWE
jgi:very-short-patch-repair endonuclease